jgi:hypothetical protein
VNQINLEALGIKPEQVLDLVVERITEQLLSEAGYDEDGDETRSATQLKQRLDKRIRERIDQRVAAMAAEHVIPKIDAAIDGIILQETNSWGEKRGKAFTLTEYLVDRAEVFLREQVDTDGRSKEDLVRAGDTYHAANWRGYGPRLTTMIDKHLRYHVENAMKQALGTVQGAVGGVLADTVRKSIDNLVTGIQVAVKVDKKP